MTDFEILALVRRLERCVLSPREFHHRDHLAVCAFYLYSSDMETALDLMRESLLRFTEHHGLKGYHETITRFWMQRVHERMQNGECLGKFVERLYSELSDKNAIYKYYSREVLESAQAKEKWIEPDLESRS